jgi:hypothetical protein
MQRGVAQHDSDLVRRDARGLGDRTGGCHHLQTVDDRELTGVEA